MAPRLLVGRRPTMPRSSSSARRLRVAIVSKNPETLDGLEAYLRGAGVTTVGTSRIERSAELAHEAASVVVFPDDFEWGAVLPALRACVRSNPKALPVIVTNAPQRFTALAWPDPGAIPFVVAKPAWGWTILDAIRAHSDGMSEPDRT